MDVRVGEREINDLQVPIPETGSIVGKSRLGEDGNCVRGPMNYQN